MAAGQQNQGLSFDQLYEEARQSVPVLTETGTDMMEDLRRQHPELFDNIEFETGPLKTEERAKAKIDGDYNGDHSKISDLTRGRIIIDSPEQVEAIRDYIAQNRQSLGVETMKDRFAVPNDRHFRDINMKIRLPNGHVAELRIEQRDLLEAAKRTHEPYEQIQAIDRRAQMENRDLTPDEAREVRMLEDEIRDIHDGPSRQAGLDQLLSEDGRRLMAEHDAQRIAPRPVPDVPDEAARMPPPEAGGIEWGRNLGRLGAIGSVLAGGYFALRGEFAQAAEVAIPGGSAAIAAAEGRPAEAVMAAIKETGVGVIATEIARPIAQNLGLDVDDGITQNVDGRVALTPAQNEFFAIYDRLPMQATDDMPPEVASLVEMKRLIIEAEENLQTVQATPGSLEYDLPQELFKANQRLEQAESMYDEQYSSLSDEARAEVAQYLRQQPEIPAREIAEAPQPLSPSSGQPAARPLSPAV